VGVIGLDGVMSPQTLGLLARFGTDRADMTEWWAMTPQTWICPGCDRSKPDLVRLNAHGELMCRLVEHHDHMGDALEDRFVFHSTTRDEVVATQLGKKFAARSAPMVSAYDNTIVCNDCNNADADAKRLVGAPRHLSFSPREIRRFINPRANEPHHIDVAVAQTVLSEILPTFAVRMRFINGIARIAASDEHWFQSSADASSAAHVIKSARWKAAVRGHTGGFELLCGNRRAPNNSVSAWRQKRQPIPRKRPTDRQIEHVAKVESFDNWQCVSDDWTCPGCDRSKVHVIRPKTGTTTFRFTAQPRTFRPEGTEQKQNRAVVCGDCWEVGIALGKEACSVAGAKLDQYLRLVRLSEVRDLVVPQPHGRHNIDAEAATFHVGAVAARVAEEEGCWQDFAGE
jgi:rubredoxin